jgi:surface antigen
MLSSADLRPVNALSFLVVPTNLGNASTWAVRAAAYGLPTGTTPRVGAAVVLSTRGAGHVGYVTAVNSDGSITISEMNHIGWNRTDERTLSGNFSYVY